MSIEVKRIINTLGVDEFTGYRLAKKEELSIFDLTEGCGFNLIQIDDDKIFGGTADGNYILRHNKREFRIPYIGDALLISHAKIKEL